MSVAIAGCESLTLSYPAFWLTIRGADQSEPEFREYENIISLSPVCTHGAIDSAACQTTTQVVSLLHVTAGNSPSSSVLIDEGAVHDCPLFVLVAYDTPNLPNGGCDCQTTMTTFPVTLISGFQLRPLSAVLILIGADHVTALLTE